MSAMRSSLFGLQEQMETKAQSATTLLEGKTNNRASIFRMKTSNEVNQLLIKRRYATLYEDFKAELARRRRAESAVSDIEATLRGRILYLELWKQGASTHIDHLQTELDQLTPGLHFQCAA